jgi:hypothetical protein
MKGGKAGKLTVAGGTGQGYCENGDCFSHSCGFSPPKGKWSWLMIYTDLARDFLLPKIASEEQIFKSSQ